MADGSHDYDLVTPADATEARAFLRRNNITKLAGRPIETMTDRQVVAHEDSVQHLARGLGQNDPH